MVSAHPSQLYADALISEFGIWMYGIPQNDAIEALTALRTGLLNLIYFDLHLGELRAKGKLERIGIGRVDVHSVEDWQKSYVQLVMTSLAMGGSWAVDPQSFLRSEFEPIMKYKVLAEFSAKVSATPLVSRSRGNQKSTRRCHRVSLDRR